MRRFDFDFARSHTKTCLINYLVWQIKCMGVGVFQPTQHNCKLVGKIMVMDKTMQLFGNIKI
jgi:hypothetical protein